LPHSDAGFVLAYSQIEAGAVQLFDEIAFPPAVAPRRPPETQSLFPWLLRGVDFDNWRAGQGLDILAGVG
jgi:hypothetical protein